MRPADVTKIIKTEVALQASELSHLKNGIFQALAALLSAQSRQYHLSGIMRIDSRKTRLALITFDVGFAKCLITGRRALAIKGLNHRNVFDGFAAQFKEPLGGPPIGQCNADLGINLADLLT